MMKRLIIISLILLVIPSKGWAFDYVTGTGTYAPQSIPTMPARGSGWTDSNFHTSVTRVTDVATDNGGIYSGYGVLGPYPAFAYANVDSTYLMMKIRGLSANQDYAIYYGPAYSDPAKRYTFKQVVGPISQSGHISAATQESQPAWSPTDPASLYYLPNVDTQYGTTVGSITGFKLIKYTINPNSPTGTETVMHDFGADNIYAIEDTGHTGQTLSTILNTTPRSVMLYWGEYCSPRMHERYWTATLNDRYGKWGQSFIGAVLVDLNTDQASWTQDPNRLFLHGAKAVSCISPTETYLVTQQGATDPAIFAVMDMNWNVQRYVYIGAYHASFTLDSRGKDVYWGEIGRSSCGTGDTTNWVELDTGDQYCTPFRACDVYGFCATMHYSGNAYSMPGWGLVSVDTSLSNHSLGGWWSPAEVYAVELDRNKAGGYVSATVGTAPNAHILHPANPARVWRIADYHQYNDQQCYDDCPMASMSMDGKYIYYKAPFETDSNVHQAAPPGNKTYVPINLYQITLPSTWWADLGGAIPPAPSAPTPSSPSDGATNVSINPTKLSWNPSTGASYYEVQVSTSNSSWLSPALVYDSNAGSTSQAFNGLKSTSTYYWRVKAANMGGTSSWSDVRRLSTGASPPPSPPRDMRKTN